MYSPTSFKIPAPILTDLQGRCKLLDFGEGGSFMTDPEKTKIVYGFLIEKLFPKRTIQQATLVGLRPSQQIVGHQDAPIDPAERYHIPLETNTKCWVYHGGNWQRLITGRIYEMDPTRWHGAVNWGETTRVHLMIDLL